MKVVILAGGFGTRLSEYTDSVPKPMIKIAEYPILWHIMQIYASYNHKDFYIACGYKADYIKKYFLSVIMFIISLLLICFLLTISNNDIVDSFKLGILTIMNTVNSSIYGLENFDFQNIDNFSKLVLIIFMILNFFIMLNKNGVFHLQEIVF